MAKKSKPYLTRAGREWLEAQRAQGATTVSIEELLAQGGKRGRPLSTGSIKDNLMLLLWGARCYRLAASNGRVDFQKELSNVADEFGGEGCDLDATLRRLRRKNGRGVKRPVLSLVNAYIAGARLVTKAPDELSVLQREAIHGMQQHAAAHERAATQNLRPPALEQLENFFRNRSVVVEAARDTLSDVRSDVGPVPPHLDSDLGRFFLAISKSLAELYDNRPLPVSKRAEALERERLKQWVDETMRLAKRVGGTFGELAKLASDTIDGTDNK